MKNYAKGFQYFKTKFPRMTDAKLKEESPQIRVLTKDPNSISFC